MFFGHDHDQRAEVLTVGERRVLLANPGTLAAMGKPQTFLLYETGDNERGAVRGGPALSGRGLVRA